MSPNYPKNAEEWREKIASDISLKPSEGKAKFKEDAIPVDSIINWIKEEFSTDKGFSHDFMPALVRNVKGLLSWIYGEGSEPYWPGEDGENK